MKSKKPIFKRVWFWVIVVIIIGIALSGGGDDDSVDQTPGNSSDPVAESPSESTDKEPEETLFTIGTPATVADVTFTVNGVEETTEIKSGNQFIDNVKTDGKFVLVNVTVQNNKKDSITINSSFFKIKTSDDVTYDPNTDGGVMMAMGELDFFLEQINPGLSRTGVVVFEVGANLDLNSASLHCQTGAWGTESIQISLKQ